MCGEMLRAREACRIPYPQIHPSCKDTVPRRMVWALLMEGVLFYDCVRNVEETPGLGMKQYLLVSPASKEAPM